MRSSFIPFISDARDAMVTVGGVRKQCWVKCFQWQGRGFKSLAVEKEKGREIGVTDDRHAALLFPPWQQSQGLVELAKQHRESQTAEPVLCAQRTVCCLPVCVPKCDLCTWTHIVARGDGQQLKFYMWLMNNTERACSRDRQLGEREHGAGRLKKKKKDKNSKYFFDI